MQILFFTRIYKRRLNKFVRLEYISGFLLFERVEIYVHICKYVETVIVLVCVFARILKLNQLVMKFLT